MAFEQADPSASQAVETQEGNRGSNQSGMRAYNERLVLTLVRRHKALPKSEIARITGLSAQTVSVIVRSLESDGLLMRGEPVRGRVGQPYVPMSLNPDGAFFFGLKVGRRSSEMMLIDFAGKVRGHKKTRYSYPTPSKITDFTRSSSKVLAKSLTSDQQERISGMGVATPFELWNWAQFIGAPEDEMDEWRDFQFETELSEACGVEVYIQNDATAACGAEVVFGADTPTDCLYLYIGFFVGGGLILNGSLFNGRYGTAGALGPMPVPSAQGGASMQLLEIASIATLERWINESGGDGLDLWETPLSWDVDQAQLTRWIKAAGAAIAHAIVSATSVLDLECCIIDGWLPDDVKDRLVKETIEGFNEINVTGLKVPDVRPGSVGPDARSLGAASLPLSKRFLLDQNAFLKDR